MTRYTKKSIHVLARTAARLEQAIYIAKNEYDKEAAYQQWIAVYDRYLAATR